MIPIAKSDKNEGAKRSNLAGTRAVPNAGNVSKIIGAAVVAATVGVFVVYGYEAGWWYPPLKSVVTDSELPSPSPLPAAHSKDAAGHAKIRMSCRYFR